jgi:hypothetical protein
MLAITIEHAVTKPMVRLGGADLTEARRVSVVIRPKFYSTFYGRTPNIQCQHRTKKTKAIDHVLNVR